MGMYDDEVLDKLPGGSVFIKLGPGREPRVRILDHPHIQIKQFDETDPVTGEVVKGSPQTYFVWPVWDYSSQKVALLQLTRSVFMNQVKTLMAPDKWTDEMPMKCDIIVATDTSGQFEKRVISAVPSLGTMPALRPADFPDIARFADNAVPLKEFVEGKAAPALSSSEGRQVIEARVVESNAAPKSDDVVIEDLDTTQKINLDDIPF